MPNWNKTPVCIQHAASFVFATNADRRLGPIDAAQVLAAKCAALACREYFARLLKAIEDGEIDPMTRDEMLEFINAEEGECEYGDRNEDGSYS